MEHARSDHRHRQLERLLEVAPDAILVVSRSGIVRYVNEAALTLFGRKREDFIGELLGFSVRDGEPLEISIPRGDEPRVCEMRVVAFDWLGEPAFLGIVRDLTELKKSQRETLEKQQLAEDRARLLHRMVNEIGALAIRCDLPDVGRASSQMLDPDLEQTLPDEVLTKVLLPFETAFRGYADANRRLAQRNRELADAKASTEAANRELEAFTESVAHDLRTPLRSITGFSQQLARTNRDHLDFQGREYLQRIVNASFSMKMLIDDLMKLSRVTHAELQRTRVDLSRIARSLMAQLLRNAPDRTIDLVLHDEITANADQSLIRIAFENLLSNALKFTSAREPGRIEFGVAVDRGQKVYFLRDNGVGFDAACKEKIFEPFQRLHATDQFDGTGVGLCIVKRIVERHGGRIWAESLPDQGARFSFTLEPVSY